MRGEFERALGRRHVVWAGAVYIGGAACQLSLDLDHTFHADAGASARADLQAQGGSGAIAAGGPGDAGPGAGGSGASASASGSSGLYGGSGGAGGDGADTDAGTGGTGGDDGSGGAPAGSGAGGVPSGGDPPPGTCSGCVELIVPVSTTGDKAVFEFQFDDAPHDLSDAVISWRVQAVNDTAADWTDSAYMVIKAYAQSPPPPRENPPGYFTDALMLSLDNFQPGTWRELVIDVASFPNAETRNDFDKTNAFRVGLELAAGSGFFGTHRIRVFVDSVAFEGVPGLADRSFDTDLEGFVLNPWAVPMGTRLVTHFER